MHKFNSSISIMYTHTVDIFLKKDITSIILYLKWSILLYSI